MRDIQISRRSLLSTAAVAIPAIAVSGCALFQQNADGSYGLSAAVISAISTAVQAVAKYAPAVESIAATAASLFGAAYSTIVVAGSAAVNSVITALENLVANPPAFGAKASPYRRYAIAMPSSPLVGYTKQGVPVFAAT